MKRKLCVVIGGLLVGGSALLTLPVRQDPLLPQKGTLAYGAAPHFQLEFLLDSGRSFSLSCGDIDGAACAAAYLQGEVLSTQGLEELQGAVLEPLKDDEFDGFGVYLEGREILRLLRAS